MASMSTMLGALVLSPVAPRCRGSPGPGGGDSPGPAACPTAPASHRAQIWAFFSLLQDQMMQS